jgi:hypothetical protein
MAKLIERDGKKYIDMTPTWSEILPTYLLILRDATEEGKKAAVEELTRMAKIADLYNDAVKKGKLK